MNAMTTWTTGSLTVDNPGERLVRAFLAGKSPRTLEAYRGDLVDFAGFLGADTLEEAAETLLSLGPGRANECVLSYMAGMRDRGLSPATTNRRLAAIRSLVSLARLLGLVTWSIEVRGPRAETYRDTRGCGVGGVRRLLGVLGERGDAKAIRDTAILRLLFDLGLRRGEVVSLDLEHIDLEAGTIDVLGKGRTQRERLTMPETTKKALADWLAIRGTEAGPLFVNFHHDPARRGRLTGDGVWRVIVELGNKAGLAVRPHGIRHAAVTAALDLTNGDVRMVQRFSRHRDLRTVCRYDDNRTDMGGRVACMVAAAA